MSMIQITDLGVSHGRKVCFSGFSASIEWGQRIAILGDNGSSKSSLLNVLAGLATPTEGEVRCVAGVQRGHVAQIQHEGLLSGGERVSRALGAALAVQPDLLLLDEPTNHLDGANRRALYRMLRHFAGAVVLVTHDLALLDEVCDTLWHLEQGQITVFAGHYTDYMAERALQRSALEQVRMQTRRAAQSAHTDLMREQERAAHARQRGAKSIENGKWATVKSLTKLGRSNTTAGRKQAQIREQRQDLANRLDELRLPTRIIPHFHLPAGSARGAVVQINAGCVGYAAPLLAGLFLQLDHGDRLALTGRNGCGKSTLARALLGDPAVCRSGGWLLPAAGQVGYLDQHYATLPDGASVWQALQAVVPDWSDAALRQHLADFLFFEASVIATPVAQLSGGERARLALACIAARPPQLLILDEVTNNLDLTVRQHVIDILQDYPGAMVLISHDEHFLAEISDLTRLDLDALRVSD
ncbi:ATPase subunit of ABC transporter with duplicated ATPase domains [Silvimonas terrae]|uniref:ATPase subunit of ABC transporter with duplicated ATPase domains n=1 Tax=Silvimonas terrae TaxID=300266 RepID=A0A840RDL5_9NEIS|nr:ATP-binding cassette domain-containing protein [Silvimonas terrae]MBB5191579.1 ATPase subunit of ABC transporter with duplicated ATPase domains [Silvimonas terrae]